MSLSNLLEVKNRDTEKSPYNIIPDELTRRCGDKPVAKCNECKTKV
ncbi:MAG TPA: hypothetical protein VFR94_07495 [Nitrososphaeraceae archaeon]|nr:hypothetical protein [Nitrososphaeraceae archaeon]